MSVYRWVVPVSRQLRTLGGIYYQSSKSFSQLSKDSYKSKTFSLNEQSKILQGTERIRASPLVDDPNKTIGFLPPSPEIKTVHQILGHGMKISNDGDCIGTKQPETGEYRWTSYSEVILRTKHIGSGFIELGLKPSNDSFIGIFAANKEEFLLSLYTCAGYSMVLVPLYLSLGLSSILYIINHAKLPLVITTNHQNTMAVLKNAAKLPTVKTVVTCEQPTSEMIKMSEAENIRILSFSEMEAMGKLNKREPVLPQPDDILCIPFTSGTTGVPKGALLTHRNAISCVSSLYIGYGEAAKFGGTIMSYLPPAHVYEICNEVASLYFGRRIAFYNGDIKDLMAEVHHLKPYILPLVPRLMSNVYMAVMKKIKQSKIKSTLLPLALWYKEQLIKRGKMTKNTLFDKYIFREFQELLGGNCHMVTSTSAPIPYDILRFYILASGAYLFEVYGSTEILASYMTLPKDTSAGHVGAPLPCNHMKLADVPEMGYFSKDDTGEICIKGENVFKGYLNNTEATNEALKDGWYHTGDIGKILPSGALKIIDRKKHLFKLSQGIYIAPEKVEIAYSFSNLILQIVIDGIPGKDYTIALVVPEPVAFKKWLAEKGHTNPEKLKEILSSKEVRRDFLLELHKEGKKKDLNSLEQARNLAFLSVPFTTDNDMLTPTFKVKRNVTRKHYEQLYNKLYEEGPLITSLKSR